jgi:hypothetical protein
MHIICEALTVAAHDSSNIGLYATQKLATCYYNIQFCTLMKDALDVNRAHVARRRFQRLFSTSSGASHTVLEDANRLRLGF